MLLIMIVKYIIIYRVFYDIFFILSSEKVLLCFNNYLTNCSIIKQSVEKCLKSCCYCALDVLYENILCAVHLCC